MVRGRHAQGAEHCGTHHFMHNMIAKELPYAGERDNQRRGTVRNCAFVKTSTCGTRPYGAEHLRAFLNYKVYTQDIGAEHAPDSRHIAANTIVRGGGVVRSMYRLLQNGNKRMGPHRSAAWLASIPVAGGEHVVIQN